MPFDLDDLLKKDQAELTRIKTALDIAQAEDKHKFEKNKFKTENRRFFGIALLTAVISLGSSYLIESFKQKNVNAEGVRKEFRDLKASYRAEDDKTRQRDLACDLASFQNTIGDKTIATDMATFAKLCASFHLIKEEEQQITAIDTSATATREALDALKAIDKKKVQLNERQKNASGNEQIAINEELTSLDQHANTIVNSVPELSRAVQSTAKIEEEYKKIGALSDKINPESSVSGNRSATVWFKEGYFLQFGEYRVLLQYLDKKLGIQVEVCKTTGSGLCPNPVLTKAWIRYNNPLEFSDDNHRYRINLESIGRAGNNPFTLAAYINFETLE